MARKVDKLIEGYVYNKLTNKRLFNTDADPKKEFAKLTPTQLCIKVAEAMIGIHEEGGNNSGKLVASIQKTLGGADREAWCMSTMQTVVAIVEKWKELKCSFPESEHCQTVFINASERGLAVANPSVGDICIWKKKGTSNGHTGIIVVDGDSTITTIEGNTGSSNGVERDGDGVYKKNRDIRGYGNMEMRGFLRLTFSEVK